MQQVMRPYATAGIALVGASIIAVTPLAVPPPKVEVRPVQLVDAWSDLLTDTTANLAASPAGLTCRTSRKFSMRSSPTRSASSMR